MFNALLSDMDECAISPCGARDYCINTPGSYVCISPRQGPHTGTKTGKCFVVHNS